MKTHEEIEHEVLTLNKELRSLDDRVVHLEGKMNIKSLVLLVSIQKFLEEMHCMDTDWTINRSKVLYREVSEYLINGE